MGTQKVLLVDLRSKQQSTKHLTTLIPQRYHAQRVTTPRAIEKSIRTSRPCLLLFLYDYPQIEGLEALSNTKRSFPSIPILMLTEQHSEKLAIWAFQAGVRDFMYSPYSEQDLEECIALFSNFKHTADRRRERRRVRLPSSLPPPAETRFNSPSHRGKRTTLALSYIAANIHKPITLTQVSQHCNMSSFAFSHAFREDQGISFQEYVGRCRVRKVQQSLCNPELSISEAALSAGFTDLSHFSRKFKQLVGTTPSTWRKQSETSGLQRVTCGSHA